MNQTSSQPDLWDRLVDVDEPILPDLREPLREMNEDEAKDMDAVVSLVATVPAVFAGLALWNGSIVWAVVLGVVAAVLFALKHTKNPLVGHCPFCSTKIDAVARVEGAEVRCLKCSDYSIVDGMELRPLPSPAETDGPRFKSPLFASSLWPRGCVACGASPTRLVEVSGETLQASTFLVGRVVTAQGRASGVPYCDAHQDALEVGSTQGLELELSWSSLKMMRRYLAANRTTLVTEAPGIGSTQSSP